jgi:3-oxoacyl-[acyl-carrier protein] reductase
MNTQAEGSTILVSGGSRGLGLHMVRHLLDGGHRVGTFARRETPEVRALLDSHPGSVHFRDLDLLEPSRIDQFVGEVEDKLGAIHGLINNAGTGQDQMLAHLRPEEVDRLLAVNLRGPILLTRSVVRRLLRTGRGGRIINISSICGSRGYAGLSVYAATKGALDAFTRSLAREVGPRHILVNAIAPGFFASEMSEVLGTDQVSTIQRRTPTERLVTPEDLLPLVDLLLFAETNMTGQVLLLDGGIST